MESSYWSSTALAFCWTLLPAFWVLVQPNLDLSHPLMAVHFQLEPLGRLVACSVLPAFGSMLVQPPSCPSLVVVVHAEVAVDQMVRQAGVGIRDGLDGSVGLGLGGLGGVLLAALVRRNLTGCIGRVLVIGELVCLVKTTSSNRFPVLKDGESTLLNVNTVTSEVAT